jgi:uncharacterized protein (TIGR02231 family)
MKLQIALLSILFISNYSIAGNEDEKVKSQIQDVIVYPQGAQINHKATYNVKPGITKIVISGISSGLQEQSLQVRGTGSMVIIDSKHSIIYPEPVSVKALDKLPLAIRKKIERYNDSLRRITYQIQELAYELQVLQTTKSILSNNGAIAGRGKVNDSLQLLIAAIEYYQKKMTEINKQELKLNYSKNEKQELMDHYAQVLEDLNKYTDEAELVNAPKGPEHVVIVTVSAKEATSGKLNVSYVVENAGWTPQYDIRTEVSTGKIALTYKALVHQQTDLEWSDVRLTISTNNPFQNKTKPTLHPWYIDYAAYKAPSARGKKSKNKEYMDQAPVSINQVTNMRNDVDKLSVEEVAVTSEAFMSQIDNMISAEFKIDLPYEIKNNNEEHIVLISNKEVDANLKYYAVPKIDNGAYLVAHLTNLDDLNLIAGEANIFFDGSYIGATYLDPGAMEDTMKLSLGKDPNIVIKRTLLKKEAKEEFIGDDREYTQTYQIEVRNQKTTNIEIVLEDQVPISTNPKVKIELLEASKAKLNKTTGELTWNKTVKAKDNVIIKMSFKVTHPKGTPIYL